MLTARLSSSWRCSCAGVMGDRLAVAAPRGGLVTAAARDGVDGAAAVEGGEEAREPGAEEGAVSEGAPGKLSGIEVAQREMAAANGSNGIAWPLRTAVARELREYGVACSEGKICNEEKAK